MKLTRHMKRFAVVMSVALVAIGALAGAALATDPLPGDAVLGTGDFSSTSVSPGIFGGTLLGHNQVLEADGTGGHTAFGGFVVTDARGTGAGWNVTIKATQFDNGIVGEGNHKLALGSLTVPLLAVEGNTDSSALPGSLHAAAPVDLAENAGVVMAACNADGQGMGIYTFSAKDSVPWELALKAHDYAGTYHSTVTTTLAPAL